MRSGSAELDEGLSNNIKEDVMDFHKLALAVMIVIPVASPVLAQAVGTEVQRDIIRKRGLNRG